MRTADKHTVRALCALARHAWDAGDLDVYETCLDRIVAANADAGWALLGDLYAEQDPARARSYWQRGADAGNACCIHRLTETTAEAHKAGAALGAEA